MLSKILRAGRVVALRGGNPNWQRPDVPLTLEQPAKRHISLDHRFLFTPATYFSQFMFNDPILYMEDPEIAKQIYYICLKILAFSVVGMGMLHLANFQHREAMFDHFQQRLHRKLVQKRLRQRPRVKALEKNFLGLELSCEDGILSMQDEIQTAKGILEFTEREQQLMHKIAGETKNSLLALVREAEEHAEHQIHEMEHGAGHKQSHHSGHH